MMKEEMITKAKEAKSVEELMALAKETGIELTEEDAKMYFEQFNSKKGELSDDELDNVSGGMRPLVASAPCPIVASAPCPKCKTKIAPTGSGNEWKCPTCGCRWDRITGEILN